VTKDKTYHRDLVNMAMNSFVHLGGITCLAALSSISQAGLSVMWQVGKLVISPLSVSAAEPISE
jgi:hypothetical protein